MNLNINAHWTDRNKKRHYPKSGLVRLSILVVALTWSALTLPAAAVYWLATGKTFMRNGSYEPGAVVSWASLLATVAILVWVVA